MADFCLKNHNAFPLQSFADDCVRKSMKQDNLLKIFQIVLYFDVKKF